MTVADDLIKAGDVAGARAALIEEVKARPDDRQARMFLSQILMVLGEWDKALTHMKALVSLSPEALTLFTAYDRVIAGEKTREAVFAGKAKPTALAGEGAWMEALLQAIELEATGDVAGAAPLRAQAFEDSPETPGEADGHRFTFIADADSRFGPTFEAILDGRYGLIAFETVLSLEIDPVRDLRDLVFLPARLTLKSGQAGNLYLPARYPGSAAHADPLVKLGRKTDWISKGDLGNQGHGQRILDAEGHEIALLGLRRLQFDL